MGNFFYTLFTLLFALAYRLAALFNKKAKLGLQGRKRIFTRLVEQPVSRKGHRVWMHCASLGEFEQGRPLLGSIRDKYPACTFVLTFFSASGYEVMKDEKVADHIFYLPLDGPVNAKRFIDAIDPTMVLWVKYEFWYHYLHELKSRNIPVLLVSGNFRQGQPFFQWYGSVWRKMLSFFTCLFVQNDACRQLLAGVGIKENVFVSGDTRFDRVIEIAGQFHSVPAIESFCRGSKVLVAGSTWEDDEAELIHYVRAHPEVKFIIAPHEIDADNLRDVQKEFAGATLYSTLVAANTGAPAAVESTLGKEVGDCRNVLIIDNVGMLSKLYRYGDITYVGGGFGGDGVHNVLEAAVYGKPVVHGPEYEDYAEAVGLTECGGGMAVQNALELEKLLDALWTDPARLERAGKAAREFVYSNEGASSRIIRYIQENRLLTN